MRRNHFFSFYVKKVVDYVEDLRLDFCEKSTTRNNIKQIVHG